MRIYMTHCSAKKNDALRRTAMKVTPDKLYTATPTVRFMKRCMGKKVSWAIFSDKFGVWFPDVKHEWYEKDPETVNESELRKLVADFDKRLSGYDEILFYHHPVRFHPFYRRIIADTQLRDRVRLFTHLREIA
jgi:hypothetical protein